jgi:hypothetical protein
MINFREMLKNNGDKATPIFRIYEQDIFEKNIFKHVFHYKFHINKFYRPKKFYWCNKLDGDILQNMLRKYMLSFLVVYE